MSDKNPHSQVSGDARKAALKILLAVLQQGQSLSGLNHLTEQLPPRDAAFARMLSFGVLRFYFQLQALLRPLIKKPLKARDLDVQLLMLMALYQILYTRVPDYAAVDVSVRLLRKSRKQWAAAMVNGVLRNFLRQQQSLQGQAKNEEATFDHPQWIIDRLKQDWPQSWQQILRAGNQQAPMTLRVNTQRSSVDDFQKALTQQGLQAEKIPQLSPVTAQVLDQALILSEPRDVNQLPGFKAGHFSVQDVGAQLAAPLLQPEAGDRILDACAAPGGKTAHLYEIQPDIQLTALDISADRLARLEQNCQRLGLKVELRAADARRVTEHWPAAHFDKILLDIPCSASGVIRRHPDIKHLRRPTDIAELRILQREILQANWPLLKHGGKLLYASCSLFREENEQQVEWFLQHTPDAGLLALPEWAEQLASAGSETASTGLQLFPGSHSNDGFYYALLQKVE